MRNPVRILLLAAALSGCTRHDASSTSARSPQEQPAVPVTLVPVERRQLPRQIEVTGTLLADEDAHIATKQPGRIIAVEKDVGDVVTAGEPLARIDPTDLRLALDEAATKASALLAKLGLLELPGDTFDPSYLPQVVRARAEAANADSKFARAKILFEQQPPLLAEQDFADIRTALEVAKSQAEVELLTARAALAESRAQAAVVATARQRLVDCTIAAPSHSDRPDLRYRVAHRSVTVGEYVNTGAPAFRLVAVDTIKHEARIPDRFAGLVTTGLTAVVRGNGVPDREGRVARVSPVVDPQSRTFVCEITLDNTDGQLKPGAFCEATITLARNDEATFVPDAAVLSFAGVHRVFSVKDGKAIEHRVTLGERRGGTVQIVSKTPIESVVTTGNATLVAGTPVTPAAK
jgi:multidrug efflux pump subunit AcrA (membrane-fusion protein)